MLKSILAVQHVRRMRGGAQSHLLRCFDGYSYVVKFQNNPQGARTLVNEMLGNELAQRLGLPVPQIALVNVCEALICETDEMTIQLEHGNVPCKYGLCFGSRHVAINKDGIADPHYEFLFSGTLGKIENVSDFLGMLVFDRWTCNTDVRQAVFVRHSRDRGPFRAVMIDHGLCFHGSTWTFPDRSIIGTSHGQNVYQNVFGIGDFEPWLERLERNIDLATIGELAELIPPEWYDHDQGSLQRLVVHLDDRRMIVRDLISTTLKERRHLFPRLQSAKSARTAAAD
jgi:hypothetical protein